MKNIHEVLNIWIAALLESIWDYLCFGVGQNMKLWPLLETKLRLEAMFIVLG